MASRCFAVSHGTVNTRHLTSNYSTPYAFAHEYQEKYFSKDTLSTMTTSSIQNGTLDAPVFWIIPKQIWMQRLFISFRALWGYHLQKHGTSCWKSSKSLLRIPKLNICDVPWDKTHFPNHYWRLWHFKHTPWKSTFNQVWSKFWVVVWMNRSNGLAMNFNLLEPQHVPNSNKVINKFYLSKVEGSSLSMVFWKTWQGLWKVEQWQRVNSFCHSQHYLGTVAPVIDWQLWKTLEALHWDPQVHEFHSVCRTTHIATGSRDPNNQQPWKCNLSFLLILPRPWWAWMRHSSVPW
jgi:hypothetical protein